MAIFNTVARIATKPLPRAITPKAHAVIDYLTVGAFLVSAAWFWRRSKRASVAALVCGGAELAVSLLTDYPGGVKKIISLRTHRDIDFGLAAMTASMPEFLAFEDDSEKKFFMAQGTLITAVSQLTQVTDRPGRPEKRRLRVA
jgi:hypothetical protein